MRGKVLVALLVTVVFGDIVEVLAADDEGTVHLGGNDGAGEDTATDGDQTGEGALLVYTFPFPLVFLYQKKNCHSNPQFFQNLEFR